MKYALAFVIGVATTLGGTSIYQRLSVKTSPYKVGKCLRMLGDSTIYKVTFVIENTVEVETLEAGLFGRTRQVFYNVGDYNADVPSGYTRTSLLSVSCESEEVQ